MRIHVVISDTAQRFLVRVEDKQLISDLKKLIEAQELEHAIKDVLSKGDTVEKLGVLEYPKRPADLTLTAYGSYWSRL